MMQVHESKTHRVGIDRLKTLKSPQTQESIGRLWRVTPKQDVNGLGSGFNTLRFWYLLSGVNLGIDKAWLKGLCNGLRIVTNSLYVEWH